MSTRDGYTSTETSSRTLVIDVSSRALRASAQSRARTDAERRRRARMRSGDVYRVETSSLRDVTQMLGAMLVLFISMYLLGALTHGAELVIRALMQ